MLTYCTHWTVIFVYTRAYVKTHKERDKPPKAHKRKSKSLVSVAWISFYTFG